MATTKDITMKQFNGTDYDTLYPKTKVEQVENLTPSSIGAVAKTGDTMTGNLNIQKSSLPGINLKDATNGSSATIEHNNHKTYVRNFNSAENVNTRRELQINDSGSSTIKDALLLVDFVDGVGTISNILHTGNLSDFGVARIATGSYVGTGYSGQSHPMSINVGFAPKFFWICLELVNRDGEPVAVMIPGGSASDSNGLFIYPFTKYFCGDSTRDYYVTVTWGSTMSWYGLVDFNDTTHGKYQFNEAGVTYYWVAIG